LDGSVLVLRRVHAAYVLHVDADVDHDKIARVHDFHADKCPVARSIREAIAITTSYELSTDEPDPS
jgi:uncharacterized OsmC-like protein